MLVLICETPANTGARMANAEAVSDSIVHKVKKPREPRKRSRQYLTLEEVKLLVAAARKGRHGERNALLILMAFNHGYRCSEVAALHYGAIRDIETRRPTLQVVRSKNGNDGVHPIWPEEQKAIKAYLKGKSFDEFDELFPSRSGKPLSRTMIHRFVEQAGKDVGLPFTVYPHMLRHGTATHLTNKGKGIVEVMNFMGHKNIQSSAIYTHWTDSQFKGQRGIW